MAFRWKEVVEGIGKFIPLLRGKCRFQQLEECGVPCHIYSELTEYLFAIKGDHWKKVVG